MKKIIFFLVLIGILTFLASCTFVGTDNELYGKWEHNYGYGMVDSWTFDGFSATWYNGGTGTSDTRTIMELDSASGKILIDNWHYLYHVSGSVLYMYGGDSSYPVAAADWWNDGLGTTYYK